MAAFVLSVPGTLLFIRSNKRNGNGNGYGAELDFLRNERARLAAEIENLRVQLNQCLVERARFEVIAGTLDQVIGATSQALVPRSKSGKMQRMQTLKSQRSIIEQQIAEQGGEGHAPVQLVHHYNQLGDEIHKIEQELDAL